MKVPQHAPYACTSVKKPVCPEALQPGCTASRWVKARCDLTSCSILLRAEHNTQGKQPRVASIFIGLL